jgi:2-C-methyl-D-erythritol 2,4-cyclodiphosphate synthase
VIDALLGAARLGDIGRLFPDDDPAYEGIDSLLLLERVGQRLRDAGSRTVNIDAVIMAQAPKLAPHIEAMCVALATALGMPASRVSVKATTTERLGFVGRQEGLAAQATVLLRVPATAEDA